MTKIPGYQPRLYQSDYGSFLANKFCSEEKLKLKNLIQSLLYVRQMIIMRHFLGNSKVI